MCYGVDGTSDSVVVERIHRGCLRLGMLCRSWAVRGCNLPREDYWLSNIGWKWLRSPADRIFYHKIHFGVSYEIEFDSGVLEGHGPGEGRKGWVI